MEIFVFVKSLLVVNEDTISYQTILPQDHVEQMNERQKLPLEETAPPKASDDLFDLASWHIGLSLLAHGSLESHGVLVDLGRGRKATIYRK